VAKVVQAERSNKKKLAFFYL